MKNRRFAMVIRLTLGVYKRVYLLRNRAIRRLNTNKNHRTKSVKITQSLKNIIAKNTGIIFHSVEKPIICFETDTKVRKMGIRSMM